MFLALEHILHTFIKTILITFLIFTSFAHGKVIVTTLPEFAWAVKQLSPNSEVRSLLEGSEDPHFVDASPGFIFKVAKAQLVISNGMELEVGWFPKVVTLSGNPKVQQGSKGYCDASTKVKKIGAIKNYNRSMGDVHPAGNPHYTLSIPRMIESIESIKDCLVNIGLEEAELNKRFNNLKDKMMKQFYELKKKIQKNIFYIYHREFNYVGQDYGLTFLDSLEKVPGVLPSANFLSKIALKAKKDKPLKVIAGANAPLKILEKFKEMSGVNYTRLPLHPQVGEDYLSFITKTIYKILKD